MKPHSNNAPIQWYQVTYMGSLCVGGEQRTIRVNTSMEMVAIDNLKPSMDYNFTVTAFNEVGASPPSDQLSIRTLGEGRLKD